MGQEPGVVQEVHGTVAILPAWPMPPLYRPAKHRSYLP